MSVPVQPGVFHAEPQLFLLQATAEDRLQMRRSVLAAVGVNSFLLLIASLAPPTVTTRPWTPAPDVVARNITPLVAPPGELTQRDPNRGKLSKEFNVESIRPRVSEESIPSPGAAAPPKPAARFKPPKQPRINVPGAPAILDAPSIEVGQLRPPSGPAPGLGVNTPPPPPQPPSTKPKLTFENPGAAHGNAGERGRVPAPPRNTVDEAIRSAARGTGAGGIVVGDEDASSMLSSPNARASVVPGKLGSSLELLSDPQGVDFRPYLIRVLASVRRNWFAVMPESARLGRAGRVIIQFAIGKDGSVPKLVIATPSGAEALDRAAVAGISASNPFPPLPGEFRGGQIRLQLAFKYNLP